MLSSSFPGQLSSASSAGAIRMKILSKGHIVNPCPSLPTSFEEYMKTEVPENYRKAADGEEFLTFKDLVDQDQPLVIFISQWAVGVLRNKRTWMFDGTFSSAPPPFSQVRI